MRAFCSVVQVATDLLAVLVSDLCHGGAIRTKPVSDRHSRSAGSFHRFLQKRKCGLPVAGFGDVSFQHLALVIDSAPEIMLHAINLHEDLIQVPLPLCVLAHVGCALRSDLPGEDWAKASRSHGKHLRPVRGVGLRRCEMKVETGCTSSLRVG